MKSKPKKSPPPPEQMNLLPVREIAAPLNRKPQKPVRARSEVAHWWFDAMRRAVGLE